MFECVTCFLLLFSHLAAPALCGVKMRDPENEVADFRSVNTSDSSGVVKRQSSQVTSHYFAIAVRLLLQSMTSSVDYFTVQPRSQGLSSLPPLVVGRKTLVAAGHMTIQNLGGKKICWVGGVVEYFVWLMLQTLWVSSPLTVAKNYTLFRGSKSNLPMMDAT